MSDEDPPGGENDPFGPDGPFGADGPLGGLPFIGDIARLMGQQSGGGWDNARQLALAVAAGGESEPNVDPAERIAFEQLTRVAELNVAEATGLAVSDGTPVSIRPATRHEWVLAALDAYKPLLEKLGGALTSGTLGGGDLPVDPNDPSFAMMAGLMKMLGPMMMSMTAGSMVGHLARRSLGCYDLPVPRPPHDELLVVHANIAEFTEEWSVPDDDMKLWVCLHELTHHAVLRVPHVRDRLDDLLTRYAGGFEPNANALEANFGQFDMSDPSSMASMQEAFGDPEAILGVVQSDAQRALMPELNALVATIVGYVDHIMDNIGSRLIGSYGMLSEALRRRRVTADPSDRFVDKMLGLELDQACYERGQAFVSGVVERAGDDGLARLWNSATELPTPNEVDAPGLWLARIDLSLDE